MVIIHLSESLEDVKANWNEYRCHPLYMPLAGWVREDTTIQQNFLYCINQYGNEILKGPLDGVGGMMGMAADSVSQAGETAGQFRNVLGGMRNVSLQFMSSVMSKAASSSSVFITYLIKIRDIFKRFVGQGYIAAYLTNVVFAFVESFAMLFIGILKIFIFAMLAISIILALFQPELLVIVIILAASLANAGA